MIKILNEEPVTYKKNLDPNNITAWIYKNPDAKEVEELKDESNELRICISTNKDYYVASSYYFTHNDILEMLDIDPYIDCIIWIDSNIMSIYQYEDNTSKFKFTYNKMIKNGLINRNTKLIDYINSNIKDKNNIPKLNLKKAITVDIAEL